MGARRVDRESLVALLDQLSPLLDFVVDRVADRVVERLDPPRVDLESADAQLLDVKQAAARLGLASSTVYKLASSKRLPRVKLGNRLLFRPEDLDAYVLEHRSGQQSIVELATNVRRGSRQR